MEKNIEKFEGKDSKFRNYLYRKGNVDSNLIFFEDIEGFLEKKSKQEIAKLLVENLGRCPIGIRCNREEFAKYIYGKSFLTGGTDLVQEYLHKVENGKLSDQDYQKILLEIEKYGSVLPNTTKRNFSYGGGSGDVILSEKMGKMYCLENSEQRDLFFQDYKGEQYYWSRSGSSGAGYFFAGKKGLIYLPTSRLDVKHPNDFNNWDEMNGLFVTTWSLRGIVIENMPVTIKKPESDDYIFVDPKNVSDIISIIKSGGDLPSNFTQYTCDFGKYVDNDGKYKRLEVKYISDKQRDYDIIKEILLSDSCSIVNKSCENLKYTGSEFDRVIGIYKIGDNFVEKGSLGVARKTYGEEHPLDDLDNYCGFDPELFDYTIGAGGELGKEYFGFDKNGSTTVLDENGYEPVFEKSIRGWNFMSDTIAYRQDKNSPGKYIVMVNFDYNDIGLSKNAEKLFKYFPINRLGDSSQNNYETGGLNYSSIISGGGAVLVANGISENQIENVGRILSTPDENLKKSYQQNLGLAFRGAYSLANEGKDYKEGREVYGDMLYTVYGENIYLGYIIKNSELNPKFDCLNKIQDYEAIVSVDDFESMGPEYREQYMKDNAYEKSIKDYLNYQRWGTEKQISKTKEYLQNNLEKKFFIEDSLVTGNCLPGTQGFIQTYNINEGITAKELLEHRRFNEMLDNSSFRNVILNKIDLDSID